MPKPDDKYTKRKLTTSYISTIVGIILVLYMLGLLGLILLEAKKISDNVKENIGFTVFLNDEVKEVDIIQLKKTLDAREYVKSTEYITKEKAAKNLQKQLGQDFVSFIGYNPLSSSIEVRLKADYATSENLNALKKELEKNANVNEVSFQENLVKDMTDNLHKISLIILGFTLLLLFIAIALINNTIRLSVYSKRFLIRTMQLIGATESFIRRPFLIKGILQGIAGAFIAIILLLLTFYFAQTKIEELKDLRDITILIKLIIFVIITGIVLSWLSTFLAVRKYLKIKTDHLYYY